MDIVIRPVQVNDAFDIHRISLQNNVLPYLLSLPSLRVEQMAVMINNLGPTEHEFVAELNGKVTGFVGLIQGQGRRSHVGEIFIAVNEEHHGTGIGTALLTKLLDLADNWLLLERVELEVLGTNSRAEDFYTRFGFIVEGRKRRAIISDGQYVDSVIMSRLRSLELPSNA